MTLSTATSGATISYTTNGSDPTTSSALYTGPITLLSTTTLKAKTIKSGMTDSVIVSAMFTLTTPTPTLTFSASPTSITAGQSSILIWSATNATSCTASGGWSGTKATSGSQNASPTSTTIYALNCTGSGGGVNQSVTVTVKPLVDTTAPTASVTSPANGATVTRNTTVTLTAAATDNVGVTKVEFYVNGTLKGTDMTVPYTCAWSISRRRGKTYQIKAKAYDVAGNIGTSTLVTVTGQ